MSLASLSQNGFASAYKGVFPARAILPPGYPELLNGDNHPHLMTVNNGGHQRRNNPHRLQQNGITRRKSLNRRGTHQQNNVITLIIEHFYYALKRALDFLT
jgi:hypothetical protein